jgi:hypothetical protein
MDNFELFCKNCDHSFKYHNASDFNMSWWCEYGGNCLCEAFVIKKITKNGKKSELDDNLDGFRHN